MAAQECYVAMLEMDEQVTTMNIKEWRVNVEPTEGLETISLDEGHLDWVTRISTQASPLIRDRLILFLRNNLDIFTWIHKDMPRIDPSIMAHQLNVSPSFPPVRQIKRVFAQERGNAIAEEVCRLLDAVSIREVYYPEWLANRVMVKKENGKWRMCVDYTDLNKAYPKDSYPLPQIDLLVDSMALHQLLSFMDAFSDYNQIKLEESNQEKTSFITSQGLFCYKVIPFRLKNVGATYQRLVNKMFVQQIGWNVEVYVDDMLVKSKKEDHHLNDLRETFKTLWLYEMKLNPSKCVFGVVNTWFCTNNLIKEND